MTNSDVNAKRDSTFLRHLPTPLIPKMEDHLSLHVTDDTIDDIKIVMIGVDCQIESKGGPMSLQFSQAAPIWSPQFWNTFGHLVLAICSHVGVQGHPCSRAHCKTARCPPLAANVHVCSSQGHPCSRTHCKISRYPPPAACEHVHLSHGHPCLRAHCKTLRCPPQAANVHVSASQGHPFSRTHCKTSKCPSLAANEHVHVSHGHPFLRAHCKTSSCPP